MRATIILSFLVIAGFAYELFGAVDVNTLVDTWGFSGSNLSATPAVFFTSIFLHGSVEHLLANLFVLIFFGIALEKEASAGKTLAIFFIGALAGDLLSLVAYPWDTVSIGASAGIFALVGAGMLIKPVDLSFYPFIVPVPLIFLGILYAAYNVYGFIFGIDTNISYIAHFGGLAAGHMYGFHHSGWKRGIKIILITLAIVILAPLAYLLLFR